MTKREMLTKAGELYEGLETESLKMDKLSKEEALSKGLRNRAAGFSMRIKDGRLDLAHVAMRCLGKRTPEETRDLLEGMIGKAEYFLGRGEALRAEALKEVEEVKG